jgi:hypothetical protein
VKSEKIHNPVAICPRFKLDKDNNISVEWGNTGRGTHLKIAELKVPIKLEDLKSAKKIVFKTAKGDDVELQQMTKKIFVDKIKPLVSSGVDDSTDKTIRDYYLHTNFGY